MKRFEPSVIEEKREKEAPEDWRKTIKSQLAEEGGTMSLADLSQFVVLHGELFHRAPQGWLALCVRLEEAKERLDQVNEASCGDSEVALYRRVQRRGYYWPDMKKDAAAVANACARCSLYAVELEHFPTYIDGQEEDWRQLYIDL